MDALTIIKSPPGRKPSKALRKLSEWFNDLDDVARKHVEMALTKAFDMAIFGLFVVIDGDRVIDACEDDGRFELRYIGQDNVLLNDEGKMRLHDLFNVATGNVR